MKVVFCIDENKRYLPLLKVAVRSLRAVQGKDSQCVCVYAGKDKEIIDTINNENIILANYTPRLNKSNLPRSVHHSIGCFLKLELSLVAELAEDDSVLYCDADVLFRKPLDKLFEMPLPPYMAMARELSGVFFHKYSSLNYTYNQHVYTINMPFPIWTHSSGVVVFNLKKFRQHNLIDHFLAFSQENAEKIENLDQSLLNYYFGKKITRIDNIWNSPPYMPESLEQGHIIHFHGPKPWDTTNKYLQDLRINHFEALRHAWFDYLKPEERAIVEKWH